MTTPRLSSGTAEPLGVTVTSTGINVAVFSAHADAVHICLFDAAGETETGRFRLPARTGDVFHGHLDGVAVGTRYGLRADGLWWPDNGLRFNPAKLLVDPYAVAIDRPFVLDPSLFDERRRGVPSDDIDSAPFVPKAIVTAPAPRAPRLAPSIPWDRHVIYELNVRGFSKLNTAIPEAIRGTFAALGHKASIDHLKGLGITAIEVMPAAAWLDERHLPPLGLTNYWGYNPIAFCAPDPRLAPGGFDEIREAFAALHEAGIAVILDVVFNHSAESDHLGPTVSLRGLDNPSYYRLVRNERALYVNDAGCGNVLAADRAPVVRLAMDAMRIWAERTGLDGFRLDLATTLARREDGFDPGAPLFATIEQDPVLRELILIAEPWDVGFGGYQFGRFPAGWGEWNDHFRDAMRRFFKGEGWTVGELATRVAGSADDFGPRRRAVSRSINFITAHDGFTLADLVSHQRKENSANGEMNRDGTDNNNSWNNGVEGPSDDPSIVARRKADMRALLAALILSRGTPMLAMGDELGRSQNGNNNAYAQDGPIAWVDWEKADRELLAFTTGLIALRAGHKALHEETPLTGRMLDDIGEPDVAWYSADGQHMVEDRWRDPENRTLIAVFAGRSEKGSPERLCLVLHGGAGDDEITLPPPRLGKTWRQLLDSADPRGPAKPSGAWRVRGRATLLFVDQGE